MAFGQIKAQTMGAQHPESDRAAAGHGGDLLVPGRSALGERKIIRASFYRKRADFARGGNIFVGLYKKDGKNTLGIDAEGLQQSGGAENAGHLAGTAGPGRGGAVVPPALGDEARGLGQRVLAHGEKLLL